MIELTLTLIMAVLFITALVYYDKLPNSWSNRLDLWAQLWLNRHDLIVLNRETYQNTLDQLNRAEERLKKLGGGSRSKTSEPHKQARRVIARQTRDMNEAAEDQLKDEPTGTRPSLTGLR